MSIKSGIEQHLDRMEIDVKNGCYKDEHTYNSFLKEASEEYVELSFNTYRFLPGIFIELSCPGISQTFKTELLALTNAPFFAEGEGICGRSLPNSWKVVFRKGCRDYLAIPYICYQGNDFYARPGYLAKYAKPLSLVSAKLIDCFKIAEESWADSMRHFGMKKDFYGLRDFE